MSFLKHLFCVALFIPLVVFAQEEHPGESFFTKARIMLRLKGPDSLLMYVAAGSEDLQNTVRVFPYPNTDTAAMRLLGDKLESYLIERLPVWIDKKRIYPAVVQWKENGKGREDILDSNEIWKDDLMIVLGAKIPANHKLLEARADLWTDREDAADTRIDFALSQDQTILRHVQTRRERMVRFPVTADSLKAMHKAVKAAKAAQRK